MSSGGGSWCSVNARIAEDTRGTCGAARRPAAWSKPRTVRTTAARCSGVVPQHPPTARTPKSRTNSPNAAASASGSSGYTASPVPVLSGSPAFGMHDTGRTACSDSHRIGSRMCSGPVEQLSPSTSTPNDSSVVIALAMSVPNNMRPLVSSVTCACTGTRRPISVNTRSNPASAALTSRMSCAVSTNSRSTPPSISALAC